MSEPRGAWPPVPLAWPEQPLGGDGVVLDRMTGADVPRIVEACNDPASQRWLPLPHPYGDAEAREYVALQEREAAAGDGLVFAMRAAGAPSLAGSIALHVGHRPPVMAIGYWTHPDSRGRGLTSAAARLLARHAFVTWAPRRVEILIQPDNSASTHVARRAGAVYEGLRRDGLLLGEQVADAEVWAFVPADFA